MKALLTTLLASTIFAGMAQAEYDHAKLYKVTVVNLTKGQPLTPPVVAVHAPNHVLVHLGQPASPGLAALAQDGQTDLLEKELKADMSVVRSAKGAGVIMPGQKDDIIVEANNPKFKFSVFTMLARTNDAFAAAMNLGIDLNKGQKAVYLANTYDAGAEKNAELCAHIPAPPCNNPMMGTGGGEGFVRPHEGLTQVGDLMPERDAFANVTAKIIVERIQ